MKQALIIVFSNLTNDARMLRQVRMLQKTCQITLVCFEIPSTLNVTFIQLPHTRLRLMRKLFLGALLLMRIFPLAYKILHPYEKLIRTRLLGRTFDLVIANDAETLPLAMNWKGAKILFDAHEYAPLQFEGNPMWKLFFSPFNTWLCKKYIPRVDSMITVCSGLAGEYEKNFGKRAVVITNAAPYADRPVVLPKENKIKLVHHGIANKFRGLATMIKMMDLLDDRFTLDMYLLISLNASQSTRQYVEQLKTKIQHNNRIRILPPVNNSELIPAIGQYDVGIFIPPPVSFNMVNTLPNKLFDFIQARLAVAITPLKEMAQVVQTYNIGIIADDFSAQDMAAKLNRLTREKLMEYKSHTEKAARELNAEKNEEIMGGVLKELLYSNER